MAFGPIADGAAGRGPPRADGWTFALDPARTNRRAIVVGLLGTILFHLLFLLVPSSAFHIDVPPPPDPGRELDMVIVPEPAAEEERPRFVLTNPEAPQNEPDDTNNISDRNQQAANPEPPAELSPDEMPAREGEEHPSDQIVAGDPNPPVPTPPAAEPSQPAPETPPSQPTARDPLSGVTQDRADAGEGISTDVAEVLPDPADVRERVEGERTPTEDTQPPIPFTRVNPQLPDPAPRPRIVQAPPGLVQRSRVGVSQTGNIGVDSRFSKFGEYMARMVEAVSVRWHTLCSSRSYGESGTTVVLRFRLHRDGSVTDLETVESSSQQVGQLLCRSAVEMGSPYGPWTEDMVRELGDEDVVTFAFHYW